MRRAVLQALLSHWRRHPLQALSLFLGLAIATALWSGVQAINAQARASYDDAANMLGQNRLERLEPAANGVITNDTFVALRRAGWQVSPVLTGEINTSKGDLRVLGIEPATLPQGSGPAQIGGDLSVLSFITPPGLGYATPETLRQFEPVLDMPLQAAPDLAPGLVMVDIGIAQGLLGRPGQISYLLINPVQPITRVPLDQIAPGLIRRAPDASGDLARLTDSFHLNLTAFGFLSFAVGLFIVHGAIGLAFEQRRPLFRTLRAIGVPLRVLIAMLLAEIVLLTLLAAGFGMVLGYVIAAWLLPDVAATLSGLYGAAVSGELALRPQWWFAGFAMAFAGVSAASAQSLWRLARLPVLAPAQPRAWLRASVRSLRLQGLVALAFLLAAVALAVFADGLIAGFAMLAALLLAAALALPVALAAVLALAERRDAGAMLHWFWADTRQQLPGLSLALMALLLALSANIGVTTMVSSFRQTFTGWLDQRLAAELYVTAADEAQAAELRSWLEGRADAVLPIWDVATRAAGQPVTLYGVADHATYRDHWPLLASVEDVWDRLATGDALLVNEQLARRAGLRINDALSVEGLAKPLPVAGIYSDYGNPNGQIMVSIPTLVAQFPDVPKLRHGVRIAPDRAPDLRLAMQSELGLSPDQMTDQAAIKAFSLGVFEQTFAVTAALGVLTLGVAGFAILTAQLTLAAMRLPQLAPVWGIGVTRRHLAWLELLRAVLLTALTMVLALPVGLVLAWVLLKVVNVAAFGWELPMGVFPRDWFILAVVALLAGGLAAAWPAWRLARLQPARLLGVFAHER